MKTHDLDDVSARRASTPAATSPGGSGLSIQRQALQDDVDGSPRMLAQRQAIGDLFPSPAHSGHARQDVSQMNRTGLPDTLKSGIESLSGMDISDVRVHRNSSQPARLDALAYAQGNDIHLGPGQEQHLPHEAWHVVQQRQGRVQPTLQLAGTAVNDDATLEHEADVLGAQAASGTQTAQRQAYPSFNAWPNGYLPAQRTPEETQIIKEKQNQEAFDKLEEAVGTATSAVVRIAVRAKTASNNTWKWQSVGHSSVQLSVYTPDKSLHIQIGLDNGGSVKIEGNLYRSAETDKYDIVLHQQPIALGNVSALLDSMRREVGKAHHYAEWMTPSSEGRGYENCTTWALKIGTQAGIAVPTTLASSMGLVPDPAALAERMRSKKDVDKGPGESVIDLKHGGPPHIVGVNGTPDVILGDTSSDLDAAKWEAVRTILELRADDQPDPSQETLRYLFETYPANERGRTYDAALRLAAEVVAQARASRPGRPAGNGVTGSQLAVGAAVAVVIGGVAVYLFKGRNPA